MKIRILYGSLIDCLIIDDGCGYGNGGYGFGNYYGYGDGCTYGWNYRYTKDGLEVD